MLVLAALAVAQVVTAVPPEATAVTVLLCGREDGCPAETEVLVAHLAQVGAPLLRFEDVAAAGPAGGDAREAWDRALATLRRAPGPESAAEARVVLRTLPLTVPEDDLVAIWFALAGDEAESRAGVDKALAAAASAANGRVWNLPPLPADRLARYLDLATATVDAPALLRVEADAPDARVYVDGRPVGPAPLEVEVRPGWHRLSVEAPGRHRAWVGEVDAAEGRTLPVRATLPDDGVAELAATVRAGVMGAPVASDVLARFAGWGREQGLRWVRFVALDHAGTPVPEERLPAADGPPWSVHAAWLDVGAARIVPGPGPATLRASAGRDRFRMGVGVGYARLQPTRDALPPHDHVAVDLSAVWRVHRLVALDARLGVLRSAQLYYLHEGLVEHDVYPVGLGARLVPGAGLGGPWVGARALAIVPMSLGGELAAGWDLAPTPRWRLGLEARGGWVDDGWLVGGGVVVGFSD